MERVDIEETAEKVKEIMQEAVSIYGSCINNTTTIESANVLFADSINSLNYSGHKATLLPSGSVMFGIDNIQFFVLIHEKGITDYREATFDEACNFWEIK